MRFIIALTISAALFACGVNVSAQQAKAPAGHGEAGGVDRAVAVLLPTGDSGVTGVVYFTKEGKSIHVSGKIAGLKPGEHGFHVHQFGDVTSTDGTSAGGHFNPENKMHGKPDDKERHAGDLGNITAGEDGVANIDIKDSMLELEGKHSILGRGLVVHANADKFTQPVGDAGGRVAVGVIGHRLAPQEVANAAAAFLEGAILRGMQPRSKREMPRSDKD